MKTKQFTKADLKTGYRVHFRDGSVGVCFESSPSHSSLHIINFDNTWCGLSTHEEDLTYKGDADLDIVKVSSVRVYNILDRTAPETTVWERKAPKSKEQIAYDEAVEATEAARQAYELAQKKLEALNPSNK